MKVTHFNSSIPHFYDFYSMYRYTNEIPLKNNWHNDIEILFNYEGENTFLINGEIVTLKENDIFIINPNYPHSSYGELKCSGYTSLLTVKNDFLISNGFKEINGVFTDKIKDDILFGKYNKLLDVHFSHNSLREVEFRIALLDLLKYIFENYYTENCLKPSSEKINGVLTYINNNYTEAITLEDLAVKFNYNKEYLSHLFKNVIGYSIIEYINILRCNYAASLIKNTTIKIKDISEMCGFKTVSNFNKIYKLFMNKSPTQTRNDHKEFLKSGKGAGSRYKK